MRLTPKSSYIMNLFPKRQMDTDDQIIRIHQQDLIYKIRKGDYTFILIQDSTNVAKELEISWLDQLRMHQNNSIKESNNSVSKNAGNQKKQDLFLDKVVHVITEHLDNHQLTVEDICTKLHISYMQFYRKLKGLTGKTPVQFIRKMRLLKGKQMLQMTELKISEVAYSIGFSDPNYFSRVFNKEFGLSPSDFRN